MGALDLTDLAAAAIYADATDSKSNHVLALGRVDEATALSSEVYDLVERVLARRPGDLRALQNRFFAADTLSTLAIRRYDAEAATEFAMLAERAGEDLVRFNPSSLNAWNSWAGGKQRVADSLERRGRITDAIGVLRSATALAQDERAPAELSQQLRFAWLQLAYLEAGMGRAAPAREAFAQAAVAYDALAARLPPGSDMLLLQQFIFELQQAQVELLLGNHERALEKTLAVSGRALGMGPDAPPLRNGVLRGAYAWGTEAALRLGRYAEAESAARARLDVPIIGALAIDPEELNAETRVGLAHALAKQGRSAEALEVLDPALSRSRAQWQAGARDRRFQRNFAHALYVSAIAQPAGPVAQVRRQAELAEAASVLATLSAEARQSSDIRVLAEWLAAADGTVPSRLAP
jgi:tetratricopeptide (TPR) repeat protein